MKVGQLRTLSLAGSPRERGRAHGEAFKAEIIAHMYAWAQECRKDTGLEPLAYLDRFFNETDFLPAIRRLTPDLLEETEGIAEGSGLPFPLVFARQLSDEEPWFRMCLRLGVDVREHCTALGAKGQRGSPNVIGQNMDTPRYYEGYQTLLKISEPDGTRTIVFSLTGKLSLCGMNSHGLGICCNSLPQMAFDRRGLAEDFIVRRVLQLHSAREALAFLMTVPHASGQNYLIGGPDGIFDLECSSGAVVAWESDPESGRFWHANHPLVNRDSKLWDEKLAMMRATDPARHEAFTSRFTTFRRHEVVERKVRETQVLDAASIEAILSDRDAPLCLDGEAGTNITLGTIIMICDAANPRMRVCALPGRGGEYEEHGF